MVCLMSMASRGRCLPKDMAATVRTAPEGGAPEKLPELVIRANMSRRSRAAHEGVLR